MTKGKRKRLRQGQTAASKPPTPPDDRGQNRQLARLRHGSPATGSRAGTARPPARTTRRTEDAVTAPPVQQPPVTVSLVRGLATVGRSPLMLAVVFGGALALWLAYSSSGVVHFASPGVMAQIESTPPVHSLLDIEFLLTVGRALSPGAVGAVGALVLVMRSTLVAFSVGFALEVMTADGDDATRARAALRRLPRALPGVLALEIVFVAAVYVLARVFAALLGPSGPLAALIVPAYFSIYAPVVLVAERATVGDSLRVAVRAARVPGRSHLAMTLLYPMVSVVLISITAGGPAFPATPSIAVWSYALFMSFVHASVLAAFVYRWLIIRESALVATAQRSRRRWWTLAPT